MFAHVATRSAGRYCQPSGCEARWPRPWTQMASKETAEFKSTPVFRKWRWIMYSSIFVGWSFYYFCRKVLPSSMASLIEEQGFTKDNIGSLTSSFSVAYGGSKLVCAVLSDHVSSRSMFSLGLVLTGTCCLLFPLFSSVAVCSVIWFMAGIVQGFGWAPCAILLKRWYPPSRMGTWWSILSSAGNLAGAVSPLLIAYLTSATSWKMGYFIVGASAILIGLVVRGTIQNSPVDIGINVPFGLKKVQVSDAKKGNGDSGSLDAKKGDGDSGSRWYRVFFISDIWVCSVVYALLYLFKNGVGDWSQLYFIQVAGRSQPVAAGCIGMMQIGGMLGNMSMGYISDLVITPQSEKTKCPRAPVLLGLSLLLILSLHLLATTVDQHSTEFWLSALMLFVGFLADGGIAVIGLASMEAVPTNLAGSAHGLACAVAQVGAFFAGWPFASAVETYSWTTAYQLLAVCAVVMAMLCFYLLALLVRGLAGNKKNG